MTPGMMGPKEPLLLVLATLALLAGCRKENPAPVDLGMDYFPIDVGRWIEYEVDSAWNEPVVGSSGQVRYRLREVIDSQYVDPAGRIAQRIERFMWDTIAQQWRIRDVWSQTRDVRRVERNEEDRRYLKMSFPVKDGQRWDLNVYHSGPALEVGHVEAHSPFTVNGLAFDSTVLVRSYFPNNLVTTVTYRERYAKHVGLIDRQVDSTNTQAGSTTGYYFRQRIVAYGP